MARKKQFTIVSHGSWYDVPVAPITFRPPASEPVVYYQDKSTMRIVLGAIGYRLMALIYNLARLPFLFLRAVAQDFSRHEQTA